MVIFGDYHTHTTFSHGKGTILENALVAQKKGLKEIAITDHGFSHKMFGVKRKNIPLMRKLCDEATEKTGVKVYLGIEANIISSKGDIDLTEQEIKMLDIIIVGYHKTAKAKNIKEFFRYILPNNVKLFRTKKTKQINTNALICAIKKYPIDIISHPGVGNPIDILSVGQVAQKYGTKMEINGKRIAYTKNDIENLVKNNVEFILSSDAHSSKRVGECDKGHKFMFVHNIPKTLISNLGKRPNFRYCKGEKD